jgi:hypothetical protein
MNQNAMVECGVCYFKGMGKEFAPKTVTADFETYECPRCKNNDAHFFEEFEMAEGKAA